MIELSAADKALLDAHMASRGVSVSAPNHEKVLHCMDRTGPEWDRILSHLAGRPIYKAARAETAQVLTNMNGRPIATPKGERLVGYKDVEPKPRKLERGFRVHGRPQKKDDPRVITAIKPNPKRPGTASYDRYELYREGMTVAEFKRAGGLTEDVLWDSRKGYIAVNFPRKETPQCDA